MNLVAYVRRLLKDTFDAVSGAIKPLEGEDLISYFNRQYFRYRNRGHSPWKSKGIAEFNCYLHLEVDLPWTLQDQAA